MEIMDQQRNYIWLDALDFDNKGGWKEDTQFVHLMGSSYLIAADMPGIPVEDAVTQITIPASGTYRIWVRTRNWLRPYAPGQFTLLVDGQENQAVLGKLPSDAWVWEIAGDFSLEAGSHTLTARDLTGYCARFSSVVITDDMNFVPDRQVERMHQQRARIKGLPQQITDGGDYDVIVVGGGPGGVPAAIACARMGVKVLLLQNRPVLGGNGSSEIGVTFDGAATYNPYSREGGIAEELRRLRDYDQELRGGWTRALEKMVAAEPNITLVYHNHVCDAETENDVITGITALHLQDLIKIHYTGRIFIDCTGDGWLGYYAGAAYRFGREPQQQHNESLAPEWPDTLTMSGCLKGENLRYFTDEGKEVPFVKPEWVPQLPTDDAAFGRVITGNGTFMNWWVEASNDYDDLWDGEEARDALFLVHLGYYDHLKNHWSKKDRIKNFQYHFASIVNGRRESRRLIGDYIFTQNDALNRVHFDDAISYTGWTLDIHHPAGIHSREAGPLYCALRVKMTDVPFRCLYSKNIQNLMMAGRNISVSHLALGTVRVQNTIATLGQAAGTAAAMCIQLGETPRGIYQRHMKQLQQQLLKDDLFILGLKNEDPGDPCLTATATASSVNSSELFRTEPGVIGQLLPLNVVRNTRFGVSRKKGVQENLYVRMHSSNPEPTTVTFKVRNLGGDVDTYAPPKPFTTVQAVVPPMGEYWVTVPYTTVMEPDSYVERFSFLLQIQPAEGISVRQLDWLTYHNTAGYFDADGTKHAETGIGLWVRTEEPETGLADCGPENVINGYNRIVNAQDYEWVSDPSQAFPQWVQLDFQKPTVIHSVSTVFDTDLTNPGTAHAKPPRHTIPQCVKDYRVEIYTDGAWQEIARVEGNIMRKRTHTFAPVNTEKIRVIVDCTWGDPSARIMEIRSEATSE